MSIFGWDYPPGCTSVPGDEPDLPEACPECGGPNANEEGDPLYDDQPAFCCELCAVAWSAKEEIDLRMEAEAEAARMMAEDEEEARRAALDDLAGVDAETAHLAELRVLADPDGWVRGERVGVLLDQVLGPRPPAWCACGRAYLNCDGSRDGCPRFIVSGATASYRVAGVREAIRTARLLCAYMSDRDQTRIEGELFVRGRAVYAYGFTTVSIEPE